MKNEKRTNYDYTIIASVSLPRKEYVLGETKRETGKKQYATWCCVNKTNYSCGHYLADIQLYGVLSVFMVYLFPRKSRPCRLCCGFQSLY